MTRGYRDIPLDGIIEGGLDTTQSILMSLQSERHHDYEHKSTNYFSFANSFGVSLTKINTHSLVFFPNPRQIAMMNKIKNKKFISFNVFY